MKTIQIYMFRKPGDLAHLRKTLIEFQKSITPNAAVVEHEVELTREEYDAFAADFYADSDLFVTFQGGRAQIAPGVYAWKVMAISAPGRGTLYVDPEGYSYPRYVGIEAAE